MKKALVIASVAVVATIACGDVTRIAGEAVRDAGAAMMDAGDAISDGGERVQPDASAQGGSGGDGETKTVELQCDRSSSRTIVYEDGRTSTSTDYFAEASVGKDYRFGGRISATVCDRVELGTSAAACPNGATCEGPATSELECTTTWPVTVSSTKARIRCGFLSESSEGFSLGHRWRKVRLLLD